MDHEILLWINRHSAPWLDQLFFRSHLMGTLPFCAALVVALAGWHLRRHEPRPAAVWVVLGLSTYVIQVTMKAIVDRARPELWERLVLTGSSSFPSGHAIASATFYPLLAWSLSRFAPRWRVLWWVLGIGLGFFVGFGRLYLGVHWPSDVLAGWAIGAGQTIMALTWLARRRADDGARARRGPQRAGGVDMSAWTDLLDELSRMPAELEQAIAQVPASHLGYRPESWGGSPGEPFAPIEHVCHVRDIERDGYHERIRRMLEEENPSLVSIDGDELAKKRGYVREDVTAALSAFRSARARTLTLLRALDDEALAREGFFAEYGPLTLRALVHYLRAHDQQHLACIQWLAGKIASATRVAEPA